MATNIELILEGLRGVASAAGNWSDRHQRAEAGRDKAAADEERRKRLADMGLEVGKIVQQAEEDPEFDSVKLARATTPLIEKATASGDTEVLNQILTDARNIVSGKEKAKQAKIQADAEVRKEGVKATKEATAEARAGRKELRDIKSDYRKDPITLKTGEFREAYETISTLADSPTPSAAKDIAIVTKFAKVMDPATGVKEGEFKTAADAKSWFTENVEVNEDGSGTTTTGASLPSKVVALFQNLDASKRGSFLLPSQKQAFAEAAEELYRGQLRRQKEVDDTTVADIEGTPNADRKKIIPRTADEELTTLEEKAAAKRRKKEAKEKDDALKVNGEKDAPSAKVMDEATFQKFFEMNQEAVTAAFAAAAQRLGRPLTSEEKNAQIQALIKQAGVQTAPGRK